MDDIKDPQKLDHNLIVIELKNYLVLLFRVFFSSNSI